MPHDRSAKIGRQPDEDRDARRAERVKTFEPILLSAAKVEVRAHLLNISRTGGLIHVEPTPDIGSLVQVNLLGEWHAGMVVWASPPRIGIQFTIRLTVEKFARTTQLR